MVGVPFTFPHRDPQGAAGQGREPALLSLEASARKARPLVAWDQDACAGLLGVLQGALDQWQIAYGLDGTARMGGASGIRCEPASETALTAPHWNPLPLAAGQGGAWWALPAEQNGWGGLVDPHALLFSALFGSSDGKAAPLANEVIQEAWLAWCQALAQALGRGMAPALDSVKGVALPPAITEPWSGALAITMPWCGRSMEIVLEEACVRHGLAQLAPRPAGLGGILPQAAPPPMPVLQAAGALSLALRVELAPLELDLGTLATLGVGDVLCTSHSLERPLRIGCPQFGQSHSHLLFSGFLGKLGEHRAVELLQRPAAPAGPAPRRP